MPVLKVISGAARTMGQRYPLDRDQIYIGRDPGNDIVLQDLGVTGYHARILKTAHGHLLIEERTSTGIWVQEQKVTSVFLEHGTRFRLGSTGFVFDTGASDTVLAAPPTDDRGTPAEVTVRPSASAVTVPNAVTPVGPPPEPATVPIDPNAPAWVQSGALVDQLSLPGEPSADSDLDDGNGCPGCDTPLVGLERFCAICGSRTRYGGRGRVMLLKVIALLLVLGAGSFGLYTLTDGVLTRDGFRQAIARVLGDRVPSWLKL